MARFIVLQPHLEEEVTLAEAARMAAVPIRTAQRWLSRYHAAGVNGLARSTRIDAGRPKLATDTVKLIEGLALRKPRLSIAAIHRKVANILEKRCEQPPSYSTVYAIICQLDPAMIVLAQEGDPAFRDQFELVYRHRAERPNQIWQADHTLLDLLIVDANGKTVRPWLTSIIDDYSRAVAGYTLFLGGTYRTSNLIGTAPGYLAQVRYKLANLWHSKQTLR